VYFGSYAVLAVAVSLDTAVFRVEALFSHSVTTTTSQHVTVLLMDAKIACSFSIF
jgi:hypothetical protein